MCERSFKAFKGKDEDGGRAEGDEKTPNEVHHDTQHGDLGSWRSLEDQCSCRSHIVWVGQDLESEHADDLDVDEEAAVGESREGGKDGPG